MPDAAPLPPSRLLGVDFSSRPTRAKPVVVAEGRRTGDVVRLEALKAFAQLPDFAAHLAPPEGTPPASADDAPGSGWVGAFDFPFGLPRELVQALGWPDDWPALIALYRTLDRADIRARFAAFCAARPVGAKFAHRAVDRPAGSSPSMKWVNPPVAFMLHAGVPVLVDAGVHLPGHHASGDLRRIALEGYPGLLARELIGARSYKADDRPRWTAERLIARKDIVDALEQGRTRLGLRLKLSHAQREALVDDATGDRLDAVLCLMQAGWAATQPRWGMPPVVDPLEGWIVSAAHPAAAA